MWITGSMRRAQDWEFGVTFNPEYEEYVLNLKTKFDSVKLGLSEEQLKDLVTKISLGTSGQREGKRKENRDEPPF